MISRLSSPPRRNSLPKVKANNFAPGIEAKASSEKDSASSLWRGVAGVLTLTLGGSMVACSPQAAEAIAPATLAPQEVTPQQLARPTTHAVKVEGKVKSVYSALRSVGFTNAEIAQRGLVNQVARLNGMQDPGKIQLGQTLIVPRKTSTQRHSEQPRLVRKAVKARQRTISFGQRLTPHQKNSVHKVAVDLCSMGFQVRADDVANFMAVETAGTFSTTIRSNGGAIGLAQFTDIAIKDMNQRRPSNQKLSKTKLARMSFAQQSEVVTEYLATALQRGRMKGRRVSDADLYAAVFCPAAVGKAPGTTLYRSGTSAYTRNKSLDHDRNGRITKAEMTARLSDWALRGENERG